LYSELENRGITKIMMETTCMFVIEYITKNRFLEYLVEDTSVTSANLL